MSARYEFAVLVWVAGCLAQVGCYWMAAAAAVMAVAVAFVADIE